MLEDKPKASISTLGFSVDIVDSPDAVTRLVDLMATRECITEDDGNPPLTYIDCIGIGSAFVGSLRLLLIGLHKDETFFVVNVQKLQQEAFESSGEQYRKTTLKALLENSKVGKVMWDARGLTYALLTQFNVKLRGVDELQLPENAASQHCDTLLSMKDAMWTRSGLSKDNLLEFTSTMSKGEKAGAEDMRFLEGSMKYFRNDCAKHIKENETRTQHERERQLQAKIMLTNYLLQDPFVNYLAQKLGAIHKLSNVFTDYEYISLEWIERCEKARKARLKVVCSTASAGYHLDPKSLDLPPEDWASIPRVGQPKMPKKKSKPKETGNRADMAGVA